MPTKRKMLSVYPNEKIIARLGDYSSRTCNMALEFFANLQYDGLRWLRTNVNAAMWDCYACAFRDFPFGKAHPGGLIDMAIDHFSMTMALLPHEERWKEACLDNLRMKYSGFICPPIVTWALLNTIRIRWKRWPDEEPPPEWWNAIYEGVPW